MEHEGLPLPERASVLATKRERRLNELHEQLRREEDKEHTFSPEIITSYPLFEREGLDVVQAMQTDLEQRRENLAGLQAALLLEEAGEMRASPVINARSRRLAMEGRHDDASAQPVFDRLREHGRQSAQRLQEMREHSWEHDARTGQRLYRPVLQTAGTAPPTAAGSPWGSPPRESEPSASGGDDDQSVASQRTVASQASRRRTDELYSKAVERAERQRARAQEHEATLAAQRNYRVTGKTAQLASVSARSRRETARGLVGTLFRAERAAT